MSEIEMKYYIEQRHASMIQSMEWMKIELARREELRKSAPKIDFAKDRDAYEMACRYCGGEFDTPKEVAIQVFEERAGEWSLLEFQKLVGGLIDKIPVEYRESARVDLEDNGYGGESDVRLTVTYWGMETDETVKERIRDCEVYVYETREKERVEYEVLKAKFAT